MLRRAHRGVPVLLGGHAKALPRLVRRPLLQHPRPENTEAGAERLRPGDARLLPLDGGVHAGGALRTRQPQAEDGPRHHYRPHTLGARQERPHLEAEDCRHERLVHHRQGTGNPPHSLRDTPLQLSLRRGSNHPTPITHHPLRPPRPRLGPRRRSLPDRCRRHGRTGQDIRRDSPLLLPQRRDPTPLRVTIHFKHQITNFK